MAYLHLVRPMDTVFISRGTSITVGPPTAHPVSADLTSALSSFLSNYSTVSCGYLVQFTYPPGYDPTVGDSPCLTCVLQLDADSDNHVFNEISRASQPVVDGRIGPWRFLDFFRYNNSVADAVEAAARPFYVGR